MKARKVEAFGVKIDAQRRDARIDTVRWLNRIQRWRGNVLLAPPRRNPFHPVRSSPLLEQFGSSRSTLKLQPIPTRWRKMWGRIPRLTTSTTTTTQHTHTIARKASPRRHPSRLECHSDAQSVRASYFACICVHLSECECVFCLLVHVLVFVSVSVSLSFFVLCIRELYVRQIPMYGSSHRRRPYLLAFVTYCVLNYYFT